MQYFVLCEMPAHLLKARPQGCFAGFPEKYYPSQVRLHVIVVWTYLVRGLQPKMQLLRLVRTAAPEANILVSASLGLLLLKTFVFNRFPSPFTGGYELGVLVESVLASVVASYVFYLFVVHLKERSDKSTVQPYINKHASLVVGDCCSQIAAVANAAQIELNAGTLSLDQVTEAFKKIHPYSPAPMILADGNSNANWFQYFDYFESRAKDSIVRVLAQLLYVDIQLVSVLSAIDDSSHFRHLDHLRGLPLRNTDLSSWASTFFAYCELCQKLDKLLEAQRQ